MLGANSISGDISGGVLSCCFLTVGNSDTLAKVQPHVHCSMWIDTK
jgi:hypothetical protein